MKGEVKLRVRMRVMAWARVGVMVRVEFVVKAARQDKTRQDKTRQDKTRQDKTRLD